MIFTLFAALCLALTVIADRIMVESTYGDNVNLSISVSALAGAILGCIATAIWWLSTTGSPADWWWQLQHGTNWVTIALVILGGFLASQVLYHYFASFKKKAGETLVSGCLSTVPLAILATAWLIGSELPVLADQQQVAVGTLAVVAGLVWLQTLNRTSDEHGNGYIINLLLMMVFAVCYTMLIEYALLGIDIKTQLALQPFYWLGFAISGWPAFTERNWRNWRKNGLVSSIRQAWPVILTLEIIGMLVFYLEFFGLGETDPTTVSLIIALHTLVVWIALFAIRSLRWTRIVGIKIPADMTEHHSSIEEVFAISAILLGIVLFFGLV